MDRRGRVLPRTALVPRCWAILGHPLRGSATPKVSHPKVCHDTQMCVTMTQVTQWKWPLTFPVLVVNHY
jgi:hypothetical protein